LKKKNYFSNTYKNLKVLITGSTGFKGAWLSYWLHSIGARVIGVGLKPEKNSIIFKSLNLEKKIKQYFINIQDFKKINSIIKKESPDIVFHLAAQSIVSFSFRSPLETFSTNIIGSANILESIRLNSIPNLVYITSDKCYLNLDKKKNYKEDDILGGIDNYSSSKASAEIIFKSYYESYFKKSHLSIASARAGNVIGGGDFKTNRIVPDVIKSLNQNKNIILRSPNATRPWQHVLEPLSGYLILGKKLINKELQSNLKPSWNFGPNPKNCKNVHYIVKSIIEKWSPKNRMQIKVKKNKNFHESKLLSLDIQKAKKELSWKPKLSLNETIEMTVDWYKNYFVDRKIEKITNNQIDFYSNK
jgi:CDP-glucose 4,6-dehydratase